MIQAHYITVHWHFYYYIITWKCIHGITIIIIIIIITFNCNV